MLCKTPEVQLILYKLESMDQLKYAAASLMSARIHHLVSHLASGKFCPEPGAYLSGMSQHMRPHDLPAGATMLTNALLYTRRCLHQAGTIYDYIGIISGLSVPVGTAQRHAAAKSQRGESMANLCNFNTCCHCDGQPAVVGVCCRGADGHAWVLAPPPPASSRGPSSSCTASSAEYGTCSFRSL